MFRCKHKQKHNHEELDVRWRHPKQVAQHGSSFLLKMLGVAAIVGGITLFATRKSHDTEVVVEGHHVEDTEHVTFGHRYPYWQHDMPGGMRSGEPSWAVICLATVLIIAGAMLAGRGRARPGAIRAMTVLGIGAIVFSVVSFFGSPPRHVLVPVARLDHTEVMKSDAPVAPSKYSGIAKRPSQRPRRAAEHPIDELPPRAGEIPVAAELAKSTAVAPAPVVPQKVAQPAAIPQQTAAPAPVAPPAPVEQPKLPATIAPATSAPLTTAPTAAAATEPATTEPPASAPLQPEPAVVQEPAVEAEPAAPSAAPPAAVEPTAPATAAVPLAVQQPAVEIPAATPPATAAAETPPPATTPAAEPTVTPPTVIPPTITPPTIEPPTIVSPQIKVHVSPYKAQAPRPDWVEAPGKLRGTVYSLSVKSGPYVSIPECQRELDRQISVEANHYIDEYLGDGASNLVAVPLSYLKKYVKKAEFAEVIDSESVGPMHQLHALLEFDEQSRSDLNQLKHNAVVTERLWYAGSGAGLLLALLGTFYGYLKLGMRTSGEHQGRLQLAATLVALVIAAGVLLARRVVLF